MTRAPDGRRKVTKPTEQALWFFFVVVTIVQEGGGSVAIVPVAQSLFLCDYVFGSERGKVDIYGLFAAIRPESYPCPCPNFCVFAQLANGLGDVPFFLDFRSADTDELVFATETKMLFFPDRTTIVKMGHLVEDRIIPRQGVYLSDLICDNT